MKYVKTFAQINKNDAEIAGGKGASLGEMTQAGFLVPPGFVLLAAAFDYFLQENDLLAVVEEELNKLNFDDPNSIEEASERLRGLLEKIEIPLEISQQITINNNKLQQITNGSKYVAVRSSATAEDSLVASWAGELETYLFTTEDNLLDNIRKCWSSLFTPRALFYRHEKGLIKSNVSVAVVVQTMIDSQVSGVTFTVHPVTKDYNQMVIEAVWGLGEAIVGGLVTPDSYVLDKRDYSIIEINTAEQEKMIVRGERGKQRSEKVTSYKLQVTRSAESAKESARSEYATVEAKVPKPLRDKQKLTGEQIVKLAEICAKIEQHYGFACDIEWCTSKSQIANRKSQIYILQSRPITTL